MRVIFLDIDGVLVNHESLSTTNSAHPDCVACLNRLTEESSAVIVVSSLWRLAGREKVATQLRGYGVKGSVIGVTPDFRRIQSEILIAQERGMEIWAWLLHNVQNVESYVILDDDKDMCHLIDHLVQTSYETGLTNADVDRALEILKVR